MVKHEREFLPHMPLQVTLGIKLQVLSGDPRFHEVIGSVSLELGKSCEQTARGPRLYMGLVNRSKRASSSLLH